MPEGPPTAGSRQDLPKAGARVQHLIRAAQDAPRPSPADTPSARTPAGHGAAGAPPAAFTPPAAAEPERASNRAPAPEASALASHTVATVSDAARPAAAPAPRLDTAPAAPPAAPDAELPDQIVQSLRLQITSGGGEARVHLRPEYLGELTVRVVVQDGVVSARLEAERPAVREWIERHEMSLRQALGEQGLTLDALQVSDHGADDPLDRGDRESDAEREAPERRRRPRRDPDEDAPRFEITA
jgi:flagellar hook-length control protein FliK